MAKVSYKMEVDDNAYSGYIKRLKAVWIGKCVEYGGNRYTVLDVDANGFLLIDKKGVFTDTTAVKGHMVKVGV